MLIRGNRQGENRGVIIQRAGKTRLGAFGHVLWFALVRIKLRLVVALRCLVPNSRER